MRSSRDLTKQKPTAKEALEILKAGNNRFVRGEAFHVNTGAERLSQAGKEDQRDHAYATVITCSDSRVPVERIFDAGVMDLFVVRVIGNVSSPAAVGSMEYGLSHVQTPLLVVLGHSRCGAVTAATHAFRDKEYVVGENIRPLLDRIRPAVERASEKHPDVPGDAIIPYAIEENVRQGIRDLFRQSRAVRDLVASGEAEAVGAIYDVGTGKVNWLPDEFSGPLSLT
jgi:carbonic anhydrase